MNESTTPNYVDVSVARLAERLDDCDDDLLRMYALLALTIGVNVTERDVHDAVTAGLFARGPVHDFAH